MDTYKVKRRIFFVGFATLIGSLIWLRSRPVEQQVFQQAEKNSGFQNALSEPSLVPKVSVNSEKSGSTVETVQTIQRVARIAPTQDQVREEVARNPHVTPKSLIFFASKMAQKFKIARTSEQNAREFYQELDECLASPELRGADSTQALCLRDAQRIAQIFPSLHEQFDQLRSEAAPAVLGLLSSLNQTGND
jgi:hypothetical protein